ncbi:uncharacterized protein LOC119381180 [Rhipicephalus sanguineus]|uniref:uncharacterized protein LOC119381180 n=1 Tax=Rhipicephalus sanguineus TaxID=34632 RepID=UPI00189633F8|nr:uncharacterized protein LOC119381180 [Rhipicephalus sanguineus]
MLVTEELVWPCINRYVRRWARKCIAVQRSNIQRHTLTALRALPTSDSRFHHVHLDIVDPLPSCYGHTYPLTCVDRFTRSAEAIPIEDSTTETATSTFLHHWVARFGVPSTITTDQGRQFESALFIAIAQLIGASRIRTTAYHPMSSGMVDRFHRQLKAALTATEEQQLGVRRLGRLLGMRSTLKEDIGCSTAELVYGMTLRLPRQFFACSSVEEPLVSSGYALRLRDIISKLRATPPRQPGTRSVHVDQWLTVWSIRFVRHDAVRRPLQPYMMGHLKSSVVGRSTSPSIDSVGRWSSRLTVSRRHARSAATLRCLCKGSSHLRQDLKLQRELKLQRYSYDERPADGAQELAWTFSHF